MNDLYPLPGSTDDIQTDESANEYARSIINDMLNGAALKDLLGIPENIMQAIYAHAYDLYEKGRIDDAKVFFHFLCTHDMYNSDYSLGMGAVHQQEKDYEKASQMYALSFALDAKNVRAMLYAGQCNLFLKNKQEAAQCFTCVINSDATTALKTQAQAYLAALQISQTKGVAHA